MDNVLIAIEQEESVPILVDAAERISAADSAIGAVRVVYEGIADLKVRQADASLTLREMILESESSKLERWLAISDRKFEAQTTWNKCRWEGILDAAEAHSSDLIIKALEEDNSAFYQTPDDWHLVRRSQVPVLYLCKRLPESPRIVAALDVFDVNHAELNCRLLRQSSGLAQRLNGRLEIVTVFPPAGVWVESGLQTEEALMKLRQDIRAEAEELIAEAAVTAGLVNYKMKIKEGMVGLALTSEAGAADVLVIGTKARRGTSAWTLGNSAESVLHRVDTNVLVVP